MASLAAEVEAKRRELEALDAKVSQTVGALRTRPGPTEPPPKRATLGRNSDAKRNAEERGVSGGRMRSVVAPSSRRDDSQAKRTKTVAPPSERRRRPSAPTSSKDMARNKRMFGVLMGSLQRANLEASTKTTAEKKMLEIDERLAEQRKTDREAFQQEKTDLLQERHAKKVELFELEQKASLDSWTSAWRRHRDALKNFILCKPQDDAGAIPIFYLPAKHTEVSKKKLEETSAAIDAQLAQAQADHWKVMAFPDPPPRAGRPEAGNDEADATADTPAAADAGEDDGEAAPAPSTEAVEPIDTAADKVETPAATQAEGAVKEASMDVDVGEK